MLSATAHTTMRRSAKRIQQDQTHHALRAASRSPDRWRLRNDRQDQKDQIGRHPASIGTAFAWVSPGRRRDAIHVERDIASQRSIRVKPIDCNRMIGRTEPGVVDAADIHQAPQRHIEAHGQQENGEMMAKITPPFFITWMDPRWLRPATVRGPICGVRTPTSRASTSAAAAYPLSRASFPPCSDRWIEEDLIQAMMAPQT